MDSKDSNDLSTCLWNLDMIGSLQEGQRLDCTSDTVVKLDTTVWAHMYRMLYRDSRHSAVRWLQEVGCSLLRLAHLDAVLSSIDTKTYLVRSIVRAVPGVRNLISLYSDDDSVVAQLQHILYVVFNLSLNILHTTSDTMIDFTGNQENFSQLQSLYKVTPASLHPQQQTKLATPSEKKSE